MFQVLFGQLKKRGNIQNPGVPGFLGNIKTGGKIQNPGVPGFSGQPKKREKVEKTQSKGKNNFPLIHPDHSLGTMRQIIVLEIIY